MLASDNSGFSIDATVRITLIDRNVPSYFQNLEHHLRSCGREPMRRAVTARAIGNVGKQRRTSIDGSAPNAPREGGRQPWHREETGTG